MTQSLTIFFIDQLRTTGGCRDEDVSQAMAHSFRELALALIDALQCNVENPSQTLDKIRANMVEYIVGSLAITAERNLSQHSTTSSLR